jgi:hypothetical protein
MTADIYAGASSAGQQWHDINSHVMEQQVFRLQTRIAKAINAQVVIARRKLCNGYSPTHLRPSIWQ